MGESDIGVAHVVQPYPPDSGLVDQAVASFDWTAAVDTGYTVPLM
jgi:hypothetical protein